MAGGKLTGYHHLAESVIDRLLRLKFPKYRAASHTKRIPLSGGDFKDPEEVIFFKRKCCEMSTEHGFSAENVPYLVRTYGLHAELILQKASEFKAAGLNPEKALLKAEIWYAIAHEAATNLSDFMIRRTGKLYFERENIGNILPQVVSDFKEFLNWNEETTQTYLQDFTALYKAAVAFKVKP